MIKNERQYRITKAKAASLLSALKDLSEGPQSTETHPVMLQAEREAIRSQLADLDRELAEYESLRNGTKPVLEVESFENLPTALIAARIASGMTQRELADAVGLKEQQVQQYEATDYSSASMDRIKAVVSALSLLVRHEIYVPPRALTVADLLGRVNELGITSDLLLERLLNRADRSRLKEARSNGDGVTDALLRAVSRLSRVFGIDPTALISGSGVAMSLTPASVARFKLPANADPARTRAYAVYAHYLALLALRVAPTPSRSMPASPSIVREEVLSHYGDISLHAVLQYVWDLGIPVLPLNDSGAFYGACWRLSGRNVIVLKQAAAYVARWLNDLLHELAHATQHPDRPEFSVVELDDPLQSTEASRDEEDARDFPDQVLLQGRGEELAEACVATARGKLQRLKSAVQTVALREGVPVGSLAYYMAARLSEQGENWWGAATNLQDPNKNAWDICRGVFVDRARLANLNEVDREILLNALEVNP